jgi:hypothetical protein
VIKGKGEGWKGVRGEMNEDGNVGPERGWGKSMKHERGEGEWKRRKWKREVGSLK